jgi:uncharacterized protein YndB with AHSA1/START domain
MTTLPAIKWMSYIESPIERVFRTLTTAEGWDGWFTRGTSLDARVGGRLLLRWTDAAQSLHRVTLWGSVHTAMEAGGPIVAIDPDERFAFEWTTAGHPTTVDFRLARRGTGTVVTVTESGYGADDLGATGVTGQVDQRSPFAMCASGWGEALTLLKFFLEHGVTYGAVPARATAD